ncbi:unnamed protein product [Didymodactylos carnosus]|uniref:BZIP domain-containing protein n=1 Tax=Didymodactylos carnosus TaxID=1234261 RepID=A0A813QBI1_9BILA|nr:unnamed protein product [Didymodactylos carnosus]CAF1112773.1 unnamed protein product [Didymodactylos carnosus]CAF3546247.1 unnamed protein product [Didymodactylos carnosus]CAF3881494.1 unnamed protein product [Didymodactylos carnosus]
MLNCPNTSEQSILEPNLSFIASNETVHTTLSPPLIGTSNTTFVPNNSGVMTNQTAEHNKMSPPTSRPGYNTTTADRKLRPNSLDIRQRQTGLPHPMLTSDDYNKLILSTPELDEKLRGYTNIVTSTSTPTIQLQTPDVINSITNVFSQQQRQQISQQQFMTDGTPSPSYKLLEELMNSQQSTTNNQGNSTPDILTAIQQLSSQQPLIIVPPDNHITITPQFLQQLQNTFTNNPETAMTIANNEHLQALVYALQKAASTPNSSITPNMEINNHVFTTDNNTNTSNSVRNVSISQNRSHSPQMDTSANDSSTSSSLSPLTHSSSSTLHTNNIQLGKIKDEPQHVPSGSSSLITTTTTMSNTIPGIERINMEQNEVVKREKKRERNRQAAQKCRTRKLTRIAELQKRVNELQGNNKHLNDTAEQLRHEISKLERQLHDHQTSGCNLTYTTSTSAPISNYNYSR